MSDNHGIMRRLTLRVLRTVVHCGCLTLCVLHPYSCCQSRQTTQCRDSITVGSSMASTIEAVAAVAIISSIAIDKQVNQDWRTDGRWLNDEKRSFYTDRIVSLLMSLTVTLLSANSFYIPVWEEEYFRTTNTPINMLSHSDISSLDLCDVTTRTYYRITCSEAQNFGKWYLSRLYT